MARMKAAHEQIQQAVVNRGLALEQYFGGSQYANQAVGGLVGQCVNTVTFDASNNVSRSYTFTAHDLQAA